MEQRILALSKSGKSLRGVAKELGVSHMTVARVLKKSVTSPHVTPDFIIPTPETKECYLSCMVVERLLEKLSFLLANSGHPITGTLSIVTIEGKLYLQVPQARGRLRFELMELESLALKNIENASRKSHMAGL